MRLPQRTCRTPRTRYQEILRGSSGRLLLFTSFSAAFLLTTPSSVARGPRRRLRTCVIAALSPTYRSRLLLCPCSSLDLSRILACVHLQARISHHLSPKIFLFFLYLSLHNVSLNSHSLLPPLNFFFIFYILPPTMSYPSSVS